MHFHGCWRICNHSQTFTFKLKKMRETELFKERQDSYQFAHLTRESVLMWLFTHSLADNRGHDRGSWCLPQALPSFCPQEVSLQESARYTLKYKYLYLCLAQFAISHQCQYIWRLQCSITKPETLAEYPQDYIGADCASLASVAFHWNSCVPQNFLNCTVQLGSMPSPFTMALYWTALNYSSTYIAITKQ